MFRSDFMNTNSIIWVIGQNLSDYSLRVNSCNFIHVEGIGCLHKNRCSIPLYIDGDSSITRTNSGRISQIVSFHI